MRFGGRHFIITSITVHHRRQKKNEYINHLFSSATYNMPYISTKRVYNNAWRCIRCRGRRTNGCCNRCTWSLRTDNILVGFSFVPKSTPQVYSTDLMDTRRGFGGIPCIGWRCHAPSSFSKERERRLRGEETSVGFPFLLIVTALCLPINIRSQWPITETNDDDDDGDFGPRAHVISWTITLH